MLNPNTGANIDPVGYCFHFAYETITTGYERSQDASEDGGLTLLDLGFGGAAVMYLVHGLVNGSGPLDGVRFAHAWCEVAHPDYNVRLVVTESPDPDKEIILMDHVSFYDIGGIVDELGELSRFTIEVVRAIREKTETYGPWLLNSYCGICRVNDRLPQDDFCAECRSKHDQPTH